MSAAAAHSQRRARTGTRRIALFGGTFDPIHEGHLAVARAADRHFHFDEIHFIPAAHPPHKPVSQLLPFAHRFAMVALACAGQSRFVPSLAEANNIATYSKPLPKKTVANRRSSYSPRWSRKTPMNHKNEIPANGTRFNASKSVLAWLSTSPAAANGFAGIDLRISNCVPIVKEEKRMPAKAAARGVFSR